MSDLENIGKLLKSSRYNVKFNIDDLTEDHLNKLNVLNSYVEFEYPTDYDETFNSTQYIVMKFLETDKLLTYKFIEKIQYEIYKDIDVDIELLDESQTPVLVFKGILRLIKWELPVLDATNKNFEYKLRFKIRTYQMLIS